MEEAADTLAGDLVPGANRLTAGWRFLSGYAHGLLWNALGNQVILSEPHLDTGQVAARQRDNPEQLLDTAFFGMVVIEKAIQRFANLCRTGYA